MLAAKAAGVASVIAAVLTTPVAMPAALAMSRIETSGMPVPSTPTAPFIVLTPVAKAVAAAAELVTGLLADSVRI